MRLLLSRLSKGPDARRLSEYSTCSSPSWVSIGAVGSDGPRNSERDGRRSIPSGNSFVKESEKCILALPVPVKLAGERNTERAPTPLIPGRLICTWLWPFLPNCVTKRQGASIYH